MNQAQKEQADFRALCAELVHIDNALDGGKVLISNQGQTLDGYSALAAFRDVADRARAALAKAKEEETAPLNTATPQPFGTKEEITSRLNELVALIPTKGALAMAEPIRIALEQLEQLTGDAQ